ncbi:MAG: iron-containing alcohol dehydrogenase [Desulfobacteraceae bacterium]|nr:iron-containing alcohol dehydrogenase [Desulfobacteraceae bacterium]
MNRINIFLSPNKVIFGNGTVSQVGREAELFEARKALIVTDKGVIKAELLSGVQDSLKAHNIDFDIFDKVEAEPPSGNVDEGAQMAVDNGADIVIGFGGGSSLDVAKGIALMARNKGKILDYAGMDLMPGSGLPKILLPTTAGTGSEVTRVLVAKDVTENIKKAIFSNHALADTAIVDPMLTLSMPPHVTADTGIDALVHAIETYVSMNATPFSDVLAIEAIRLIAENLPTAYAKAENITARYNMSLAATLAGLAMNSGGVGAVHGLSNILGIKYHMSHGRANAVMLPYVVDYNKIGNPIKYAAIALAMGENTEGLSPYNSAEKLVLSLFRLLEIINISAKLSDYDVTEADIPSLVEGGMKLSRLFVPNPRNLTKEDIKSIYTKAL